MDLVEEKDNLFLMGDFNAVIGEGQEDNIVGKYGLGVRNKRGDRLVQFCKEYNLTVSNTIFKQPKRRRYTWKMPGNLGRYQLDYIIVKEKYKNMISNCKTYPGADVNSDHNLLVCKMDMKIRKINRKQKTKTIDLNKLRNSKDTQVQYSNKLENKFKTYNDKKGYDNSIDTRWCNIRNIIKTSAEECLKKEKLKPRKKWLDTETIDLMIERRKYRNKEDCDSIEEYKKLTNKITLKCRYLKEKDIEKDCENIDYYTKRGKMDLAYNIIRNLGKKHKTKSTAILDENNKILIDSERIVERWKRYIEDLYKGEGLQETDIEREQEVEQDNLGPMIMRSEFNGALRNIKNDKGPGEDEFFIEFIKYSHKDILEEIYKLTIEMYEKGEVPKDFKTTKTVTLPKKLNTHKCEEHRTLSLTSQASKILLKIIQNRIRDKIEKNLSDNQYGFRKNKGTREAILALRLIIDRRMDMGLNTHIAFVDLEKAFDKVDWKIMMKILRETGLDYRDRKIIYELYKDQETIINVANEKRTAKIRQGVRQGCSLSPLIFNIFIESAIKIISEISDKGVKFHGETIKFIRFADDIAAVAETQKDLEELLNIMNNTFKEFSLKINKNKTKIMNSSKTGILSPYTISIDNTILENVKKFKYLGSLITADSRCTPDIKSRISMAKQAFLNKKHIFTSKMTQSVKKKFIKSYVWSIALYGCETWTTTRKDKEILEAFEMWCWRRMEKINWKDKIKNTEVLRRVREERTLMKVIENRRGKLMGHLIRHDRLIKNIIEGKVEGKRGRGRPRISYMSQIKEKVAVMSYKEVKDIAMDRERWRDLHRLHRQELAS